MIRPPPRSTLTDTLFPLHDALPIWHAGAAERAGQHRSDGSRDPRTRRRRVKGLDTNVLVRFIVQDDPAQARRAGSFIRNACTADSPCRVNRIVLCELVWVLESAYGYPRQTVAEVIDKVLRTGEFSVEDADEARTALRVYREGEIGRASGREQVG